MKKQIGLTIATLLMVSACATKPEVIQPPVQAESLQRGAPIAAPEVEAPREELETVVVSGSRIDPGPAAGSLEEFSLIAGDRVYFGYDQYDLSGQSIDVLRRQAQWLNTYQDRVIVIEGNADERGTREYNLALGARRAESVKSFLVSQGVDPRRMTTVSYGKERPIDGGSNEQAWSRNRNSHTNVLSNSNS